MHRKRLDMFNLFKNVGGLTTDFPVGIIGHTIFNVMIQISTVSRTGKTAVSRRWVGGHAKGAFEELKCAFEFLKCALGETADSRPGKTAASRRRAQVRIWGTHMHTWVPQMHPWWDHRLTADFTGGESVVNSTGKTSNVNRLLPIAKLSLILSVYKVWKKL